ncbi:TonB-dependent receptor plug domain-containing protein [Pelagicoccus mobilis]|uniref:TonB-dependent receptor plug domain-containing protein n=1 Tax=Pelagicoccus mobilis TaxID=415221 RepID=A0A934VTF8_9BACT|nr:TonB-dependent receptor plug domain-containing protein [Pelagicoccus mobilis]MBK1880025.1 TonB-dependent receptor plug domain-containing protein [Pelagicoccus mobilis]
MTLKLNWQICLCRVLRWSVAFFLVAYFVCHVSANTADSEMKSVRFDVPEGKAIDTLREAARQANVDIMFAGLMMEGIVTPAIEGAHLPQEAFELMLAGTPLAVSRHEKSGVFTVRKIDSDKSGSIDSNPDRTPPMNQKKPRIGKFFKGLLTTAIVGSPAMIAQDEDTDEEVFELSPFTVNSAEDTGYRATTTLAGTRLKTQIKDIGSAISVLTEEMFEDTGATDAATVLSYALNTEVAGDQGNFSGNTSAGDPNLSGTRVNPQGAQRVRGLGRATLTRNYFLTDIPFDSYNTDRVTINRGPNSLLFGIGEPGGVINNSARSASVSKSFGEASVRFGERGSNRFSFDLYRSLIEDRLAIRIAALSEETNFQQEPAYEEDERIYLALNSVLFKNEGSDVLGPTKMRLSYEDGEINSTPVNVIAPYNSLDSWFGNVDRSLEAYTGVTLPSYIDDGSFQPKFTIDGRPGLTVNDVNGSVLQGPFYIQFAQVFDGSNGVNPGLAGTSHAGFEGRILFNGVSRGRFDLMSPRAPTRLEGAPQLPGFTTASLPQSVFNNQRMLLTGNLDTVNQDFDAFNAVLEQSFLDNRAGIEIAFDKQSYRNQNRLPVGSSPDVRVDANEFIQVGPAGSDGSAGLSDMPNPNLGRAFIAEGSMGSHHNNQTDREAIRATAFYTLDLKEKDSLGWLGSHTFTAFYNKQTIDRLNRSYSDRWFDDGSFDIQDYLFAPANGFRRQDPVLIYLTDSLLGSEIQSTSDIRITSPINAQLFQNGDTGSFSAWNRTESRFDIINPVLRNTLSGGNRSQLEIESSVLSWQGHLFDGALVGLVGYRTDETEGLNDLGTVLYGPEAGPDLWGVFDESALVLDPSTLITDEGDTLTTSVVAHLPWKLPNETSVSLHYNESENFSPSAPRRTILNNLIGTPFGDTQDYGITFDMFGGKVIARANWFKTTRSLASANTGGALGGSTAWISQWLTRWQEGIDAEMTFDEAKAAATVNGTLGEFPSSLNSYQDVFDEIIGWVPSDVQSIMNFRLEDGVARFDPIENLAATNSFVTEGFEIDLAGNIAPNWRVALNVGKQESTQSNTAPDLSEFVLGPNGVFENVRSSPLAPLSDTLVRGFESTFVGRYTGAVVNPLAATTARDGTLSLEQRKWRVNLTTNYSFTDDSMLAGFGVGGAIRWQDSIAVGYPQTPIGGGLVTPVLSSPYFGPDETNVDLWFSYKTKISDGKLTWKSQLNIRNAFGSDDNIPVVINPDGQIAVFRNPNPTEVFWTNTFSF